MTSRRLADLITHLEGPLRMRRDVDGTSGVLNSRSASRPRQSDGTSGSVAKHAEGDVRSQLQAPHTAIDSHCTQQPRDQYRSACIGRTHNLGGRAWIPSERFRSAFQVDALQLRKSRHPFTIRSGNKLTRAIRRFRCGALDGLAAVCERLIPRDYITQ